MHKILESIGWIKKKDQAVNPNNLSKTILPSRKINIDGLNYEMECSIEEFEKRFEITFLPTIVFQKKSYFLKVQNLCKKGIKRGYLDEVPFWLGSYYQKEIESYFTPPLLLKWINPIMEWGVFANVDLKENSFIGEYTGVVRPYQRFKDRYNAYCFEYTIGMKKTRFTIDAKENGNITRFINHSYNPNITQQGIIINEIMHVILKTSRPVKKGEELTYNYGYSYWKKREKPL